MNCENHINTRSLLAASYISQRHLQVAQYLLPALQPNSVIMKSFVAITLAVLAVAVTANPVEESNFCLKTTEPCTEFGKLAKAGLRELQAITVTENKDVNTYLNKLEELLRLGKDTQCHIDVCKCDNGALTCAKFTDKLRGKLSAAELPECLKESAKATEILNEFKEAIAKGDRDGVLEVLGKMRMAINQALETKSEEDSQKLVNCLKETVLGIRMTMNAKLAKFHPRPNCDFCTDVAPSNPAALH